MASDIFNPSNLNWLGKGLQFGSLIGQGFVQQASAEATKGDLLMQAMIESMKQDYLKLQLSQQIAAYSQARSDLFRRYTALRERAVQSQAARGVAVGSGSALATLAGIDAVSAQDQANLRYNFENTRTANEIAQVNAAMQEKGYRAAASAVNTDFPWFQTLLGAASLFAGV